jgi:RimJ/RimL family protein N-acetyltransferase
VVLTTFAGLDAARALYERLGFRLVAEADGETWGTKVREQRFEWAP